MDSPTEDANRTPASYADFSSEEEQGGWLKTSVQFFAIPMLIVVLAVGVFFGVSLMIGSGPRSAAEFTKLLASDTVTRRWHAAFELAARLKDGVPDEFHDAKLNAALCSALERARKEHDNPPTMAVTTLLLLGRIGDSSSIPTVRAALEDEHPWVRAYAVTTLATLRDHESRDAIANLVDDEDPPTRQAALTALASLDQRENTPYHLSAELRGMLKTAVGDRAEDVRFTAAILLARVSDRHGALPVLKTMLDRGYLEKIVPNDRMDTRLAGISRYRVHSNVIVRALDAVERLDCGDDEDVVAAVRKLSESDTEGDSDVRYRAQQLLTRWKKQQGA